MAVIYNFHIICRYPPNLTGWQIDESLDFIDIASGGIKSLATIGRNILIILTSSLKQATSHMPENFCFMNYEVLSEWAWTNNRALVSCFHGIMAAGMGSPWTRCPLNGIPAPSASVFKCKTQLLCLCPIRNTFSGKPPMISKCKTVRVASSEAWQVLSNYGNSQANTICANVTVLLAPSLITPFQGVRQHQ